MSIISIRIRFSSSQQTIFEVYNDRRSQSAGPITRYIVFVDSRIYDLGSAGDDIQCLSQERMNACSDDRRNRFADSAIRIGEIQSRVTAIQILTAQIFHISGEWCDCRIRCRLFEIACLHIYSISAFSSWYRTTASSALPIKIDAMSGEQWKVIKIIPTSCISSIKSGENEIGCGEYVRIRHSSSISCNGQNDVAAIHSCPVIGSVGCYRSLFDGANLWIIISGKIIWINPIFVWCTISAEQNSHIAG